MPSKQSKKKSSSTLVNSQSRKKSSSTLVNKKITNNYPDDLLDEYYKDLDLEANRTVINQLAEKIIMLQKDKQIIYMVLNDKDIKHLINKKEINELYKRYDDLDAEVEKLTLRQKFIKESEKRILEARAATRKNNEVVELLNNTVKNTSKQIPIFKKLLALLKK